MTAWRKKSFAVHLGRLKTLEFRKTGSRKKRGKFTVVKGDLYDGGRKAGAFHAVYYGRHALSAHIDTYSATIHSLSNQGKVNLFTRQVTAEFGPCAADPDQALPDDATARSADFSTAGALDAGGAATVRVLVAYVPDAAPSGPAAVEAQILGAETLANTTYSNSGISHRISVVAMVPVLEPEGGDIYENLYALARTGPGYEKWNELHTLRETYQADAVSLVVENGGGACGVAYVRPDQRAGMFSIVDRNCFNNHSFTHELGHNFGAGHDAGNGEGYFPDSHGWRFTGNNFVQYRTVMAYSPGTRIPYFSGPGVFFQGVQTGVTDVADNVKTLNYWMPLVATDSIEEVPTPAVTPTTAPGATPGGGSVAPVPTAVVIATPLPTPAPLLQNPRKNVRASTYTSSGKKMIKAVVRNSLDETVPACRVKVMRKLPGRKKFKAVVAKATDAGGVLRYKPSKAGTYRFQLTTGEKSRDLSIKKL